jgi:hypothetical protein
MNGRFAIAAALAISAISAGGNLAYGQNPNNAGYIGVYVVEGNGGMKITGFIQDTPAQALADDDGINRNDTIVKLGGRATRTLSELKYARNMIPQGQEAKMLLRNARGYYHVWISRSPPVAALDNPNEPTSTAVQGGAPDNLSPGEEGLGGEKDFRPLGGEEGGSFGSPAPKGSAPKAPKSDDDGDFRPKKD